MVKNHGTFMKSYRKLIIFSSILVLLLAIVAGRMIYERSVVNEMRAIANQIQVTPLMVDQRDYIVPPTVVCLGDEPCPMYDRSWRVTDPMSKEIFAHLSRAHPVDGTCERSRNAGGSTTLCTSSYTQDGYSVDIIYSSDSPDRTRDSILIRILRND